MHWAAYNGDEGVIECLLENDGLPYLFSSPKCGSFLPIDIAGLRPSMLCIDVLLASYAKENSIITMKRSRAGQLLERMKKYIEPDD